MSRQYNQAQFQKLIVEYFDKTELKTLCVELDIDYEILDDPNKLTKVQSLVAYMARHDRLDALYDQCKEERPHANWESILQEDDVPPVEIPQTEVEEIQLQTPELQQPKKYIYIALGVVAVLVLIGAVLFGVVNSQERSCPDLFVSELSVSQSPIKTGETAEISVHVDNPKGRILFYDWIANKGTMQPGLGTTSSQSDYQAPEEAGPDFLTVKVHAEGCESKEQNTQVFILENQASTPTPTVTSQPTETAVPTKTPVPTRVGNTISTPDALCLQTPGPRWGDTLWPIYQEQLACALIPERRIDAAYQPFEHGMAVWRAQTNVNPELIYLLYEDGTYEEHPVLAPAGFFQDLFIKGAIGYLWNTNSRVQEKLGEPVEPENNATNFAIQEFKGGVIFYFLENEAHNYVLLNKRMAWESIQ